MIKILLLLQSRRTGTSVAELASEMNVTPRTIYRDLRVLEDVGAPLVSERFEDSTVWRLIDGDRWRMGIPLGVAEVVGIHMAARVLEAQGGEPWSEALSSALEKIGAAVPGKFLQRLEELEQGVSASDRGSRGYRERHEILAAVTRAVEDRRVLEIQYATPGRPRPVARRVHPYGLRLHDQGLYIVAWDTLRERVGTFLVDRIRLATVSEGKRFELPEGFDLDGWFSEALGVHLGGPLVRLRARATSRVAHLIEERRWHPSLITRPEPGGGVELSMEVRDNPELRSWLLSFGADLVVRAPLGLARDLAMEGERMSRSYAMERGRRAKVKSGGAKGRQAARRRGRVDGREEKAQPADVEAERSSRRSGKGREGEGRASGEENDE